MEKRKFIKKGLLGTTLGIVLISGAVGIYNTYHADAYLLYSKSEVEKELEQTKSDLDWTSEQQIKKVKQITIAQYLKGEDTIFANEGTIPLATQLDNAGISREDTGSVFEGNYPVAGDSVVVDGATYEYAKVYGKTNDGKFTSGEYYIAGDVGTDTNVLIKDVISKTTPISVGLSEAIKSLIFSEIGFDIDKIKAYNFDGVYYFEFDTDGESYEDGSSGLFSYFVSYGNTPFIGMGFEPDATTGKPNSGTNYLEYPKEFGYEMYGKISDETIVFEMGETKEENLYIHAPGIYDGTMTEATIMTYDELYGGDTGITDPGDGNPVVDWILEHKDEIITAWNDFMDAFDNIGSIENPDASKLLWWREHKDQVFALFKLWQFSHVGSIENPDISDILDQLAEDRFNNIETNDPTINTELIAIIKAFKEWQHNNIGDLENPDVSQLAWWKEHKDQVFALFKLWQLSNIDWDNTTEVGALIILRDIEQFLEKFMNVGHEDLVDESQLVRWKKLLAGMEDNGYSEIDWVTINNFIKGFEKLYEIITNLIIWFDNVDPGGDLNVANGRVNTYFDMFFGGEEYSFDIDSLTYKNKAGEEIEILDPTGAEEIESTNYDIEFDVYVREGGSYIDFAEDEIEIQNQADGSLIEYEVSDATVIDTSQNINEYTYTLHNLTAGEEYNILMDASYSEDAYEQSMIDAVGPIKINTDPIQFYEATIVDNIAPTIGRVDGTVEFDITDGPYAKDITSEDLVIATTNGDGELITSSSVDAFEDDSSGITHVSATMGTDLTPNTTYETSVIVGTDIIYSDEWTTLDWMAPEAPEIVEVNVIEETITKHEASIAYEITVPRSNDEALGEDTTQVDAINLYTAGDIGTGTPVMSVTDIDDSATTLSGQFDLTDLELDTEYTYVVEVAYSGVNSGFTGTVVSEEINFETEGLDPATPPKFDSREGLVEVSHTETEVVLDWKFAVEASNPDKVDTIISDYGFGYQDSTGAYIEFEDSQITNFVYETSTDSAMNTIYEGSVKITNLTPNTSYDMVMGVASNSEIEAVSYSSIESVETDRYPGRLPEFNDEGVEFVSSTSNTLTFSYDFTVPTVDLWYEDTVFENMNVYASKEGEELVLLTPIVDYSIEDAGTHNADGTGKHTGTITLKNLDPATNYQFKLGLDSKALDPQDETTYVELEEVLSETVVAMTDKEAARSPFFAREGITLNSVGTEDVTVGFDFFIPAHDEAYWDTYLENINVYLMDTYLGETSFKQVSNKDLTITYEREAVTSKGGVLEYKGEIKISNLNPEDSYKVYLGVETSTEDTSDKAITPDEVYSSTINFQTQTNPPQEPTWNTDEVKDGFALAEDGESQHSITVDFDFEVPADLHGYAHNEFQGINAYIGTSEGEMVLLEDTEYTINYVEEGNASAQGTYSGSITFNNLDVNTRYFMQIGIDTLCEEETLSAVVEGKTTIGTAIAPEVLDAEVVYDKTSETWLYNLQIQMNNTDKDYAPAKMKSVSLGQYDEEGDLVTTKFISTKNLEDDGASEGSAVVDDVINYSIAVEPKFDFEQFIENPVVVINWEDTDSEGAGVYQETYELESFRTEAYEIAEPAFEAEAKNITQNSVTIKWNFEVDDIKDYQADTLVKEVRFINNGEEVYNSSDDSEFEIGDHSGKVEITGLEAGTTYSNFQVEVDYFNTRNEKNYGVDSESSNFILNSKDYNKGGYSTKVLTLEPFTTDEPLEVIPPIWIIDEPTYVDAWDRNPDHTIPEEGIDGRPETPGESFGNGWGVDVIEEDPIAPIEPEEPKDEPSDKEKIKKILIITFLVIFTLGIAGAILYPALKKKD